MIHLDAATSAVASRSKKRFIEGSNKLNPAQSGHNKQQSLLNQKAALDAHSAHGNGTERAAEREDNERENVKRKKRTDGK